MNKAEQEKKRLKEFYEKNKARILTKLKKEREENPEKIQAIKRDWRKNNKDKVKIQKQRYAERHPERIIKQQRDWREKNREKISQYLKIYQSNPDEKWKAIVRLNTLHKYGKAECCLFCNSKEQVEHHHPKPYNMDVFIDLCKKCHHEIHKMEAEKDD